MLALIDAASRFLGMTATLAVFALLLIWGLFLLLGIPVRRRHMRFLGVLFLGVTLSMLMGLTYPDFDQTGNNPGGEFGNWVYLNLKLVKLENLACVIIWIATAASMMLATDWLFIEYITRALGISQPSTSSRKSPMKPSRQPSSETKTLRDPIDPIGVPRPMPVRKDIQTEPEQKEIQPEESSSHKGIPLVESELEQRLPTEQWWVAPTHSEGVQETDTSAEEETLDPADETQDTASSDEIPDPCEVPTNENTDPFVQVATLAFEKQDISIPMIQKELNVGYTRAAQWIDRLEKEGIISSGEEGGKRKIIVTQEALNKILNSASQNA